MTTPSLRCNLSKQESLQRLARPAAAALLGLATLLAGGAGAASAQQTPPAQPPAAQAQATSQTAESPAAAGDLLKIDTIVRQVPVPAELPVQEGAIALSLDEAIEIALRNNLALIVQRYNRDQARLGILQELGIYDLQLDGSLSYQDDTAATISQLEAGQLNVRRLFLQVGQPLPTGGVFSLGTVNRRTDTNNQFAELNPSFDSDVTFNFFQPLLRNGGRATYETALRVARVQSEASRELFETQVNDTIQQVTTAYWNLVEAQESLGVAQESLNLAKELHERNKIQVEVGTSAPLELTQSEAAIAERDEAIIQAQAAIGNAEDQLRLLLDLPEGQYWSLPIRTTTSPETDRLAIDLPAAIATAIAERPELRGQDLTIEQRQIEATFARNQTLPQLDLNINYGYGGVGSDFSDAFEQVTGLDFDGLTATLTFGFPLQNRRARAAYTIANLAVDQARTERERLETVVTTEVRQAARAVETAAKQIEAASISRQFQEKNLEAERKRYENGMSTSFQITQIQENLTEARQREVSAVLNYRRALIEFYRSTGRLLEEEGVELVDPADNYKRYSFSLFR